MSTKFKPTYHDRNLKNIAQLGDKTKTAAMKFYQAVIDSGIDLLIYSTIRTEAEQRENIKNGVSQTMKSFHITGQAMDAVLVRNKAADWNGYGSADFKKVVSLAKKQKFTWGGDWKSFVDKPHFQYDAIAYGADTFKTKGKVPEVAASKPAAAAKADPKVLAYQKLLIKAGQEIKADGFTGPKTTAAVKAFQKQYKLSQDGIVGPATLAKLKAVTAPKPAAKPAAIKAVGTIEIVNVENAAYIVAKPSSKGKNLATIKRGGRIKISGSVPGWFEVIYDGERAYINEKYGKRV